eukprot:TRINITY_DN12700_c0_g1_i1.p1 TRINITY_DN12700_c0_g1~~TRINITY_DN12700_c0_g1_i1.p1  ORF type:complete len:153 (+),score=28.25 TRINITY_DN12700_c0_g1_i1:358-816(+)
MKKVSCVALFVLVVFAAFCYAQVGQPACPSLRELCLQYPDKDYFVQTITTTAGPDYAQSYFRYKYYYDYYINDNGVRQPTPTGFRIYLLQNKTQPFGSQLDPIGIQHTTAGAAGCVESFNFDGKGVLLGLPSNITSNEFRFRNQNSTFWKPT